MQNQRLSQNLILFLIMFPLMVLKLASYPLPWYDEGYNTHTASILQQYGVYGTYTVQGFNTYNPAVTTGPTVLLLIAVTFGAFGAGIFQARIVSVMYALIAVLFVRELAERTYGQRSSLFVSLFFLASPAIGGAGFILLSRQVLGEITSLFYALFGFYLWSRAWGDGNKYWSLLAGIAFGLGIISKFQSAISIVPTLMLLPFILARSKKIESRRSLLLAPLIAIVIMSTWLFVQTMGQNPAFRLQNSQDNMNAIRILLLPGFWQRTLTPGGVGILLGMVIAVIVGVVNLRGAGPIRSWQQRNFLELSFILIVSMHGLWFTAFSIGWPRYLFFGWSFALLLLGSFAYRLTEKALKIKWLPERARQQVVTTFAPLALIVAMLIFYLAPILSQPVDHSTTEMGNLISRVVKGGEILESWEWQVDALSGHWNVSHPPQSLMLEAISQRFVQRVPFDLEYDILAQNPDYLLTGPFSDWTRLYDPETVDQYFNRLTTIGPYTLWQRSDGG